MFKSLLWAFALAIPATQAVFQGFNSGSDYTDGTHKQQADFEKEFSTAKGLADTNGAFTSVRLFTSVQGGSQNTPTSAIPAAIKNDVTMLLGVWGSGGDIIVNNEIAAIKSALDQYGDDFAKRVAGISVGSEDLYRFSDLGQKANAGIGASPEVIANYIKKVRDALKDTKLSKAPIGHVDTWTAWVDPTTKPVIDACDFIGQDAYPYFENTHANSIDNAKQLFFDALAKTKGAAGGKPVWITESGWPVAGPTENLAIPSMENAEKYWKAVACALFGKENTWWFILQDARPNPPPGPTFGLIGSDLNSSPYYSLSCEGADTSIPSPSGGSDSTGKGSDSGSDSGSKSDSGSDSGPKSDSSSDSGSKSDSAPDSTSGGLGGGSSTTGTGSLPGATSLVSSVSSNSSTTYVSSGPSAGATEGTPTGTSKAPLSTGAAAVNSFFIPGMLGAAVAAVMAAL